MLKKQLILLFSIASLAFPLLAFASNGPIEPAVVTLAPRQQQQFLITGNPQGVTWWVQAANVGTVSPQANSSTGVQAATLGTISDTGLYTAPASPGIVFVYAQLSAGAYPLVSTFYVSIGSA